MVFQALAHNRFFPRFWSTRKNMPAFKLHVKITRSTNLLSVCRRKLKLSTNLHTVSYNHISFRNARSQLVWVLASSGFYSITWRMISRSAGYKIHFRKQPPFRRNFFPLVWYLSFLWISTPWQFVHGSRVFVQLNETFTQTLRECLGYFTQLAETSFFNNVILHLNEIIKNDVVIQNYSCKSLPFIQRWGNLLCQSAWENHGNSWLTSTKTQVSTGRKNPSRVRVSGNRCNHYYRPHSSTRDHSRYSRRDDCKKSNHYIPYKNLFQN